MLWVATTILALSPQGPVVPDRGGRIVLPPPERVQQDPTPKVVGDGIQRRFHERVLELRRSRLLSEITEEDLLRRIGVDFEDAAKRAVKLARSADADLMHGVMRVLATYGGEPEAQEIKFLLHTRSFGKATPIAVGTMATIARGAARELLFDCLTASREFVRRAAATELESRVTPDDVPRLVTLASQGKSDVRVRALRLLGRVPDQQSLGVLVNALRDGSRYAVEACRALINAGSTVVPALTEILERPASSHEFGFAAFALASLEESTGRPLFSAAMTPHLIAELDMPDGFMRSAAAIALSGVAWRSTDTTGTAFHDREVVERLVAVVAPREFVQHVSLIQDLARVRLVRLSGRDFQLDHGKWRDWWEAASAVDGYVATRQELVLDVDSAPLAVVTWRDAHNHVRLRGTKVDPLPPSDEIVLEFLVAPEDLVAIVDSLRRAGFMRDVRRRGAMPADSLVRLTIGAARCQTDAMADLRDLKPLSSIIEAAANERIWQLYRDSEREPDIAAFWRSERRWLAANTDPKARDARLVDRIARRLPDLAGDRLSLAIDHLRGVQHLRDVLNAEHTTTLVEALRSRDVWDESSDRIADVILAAGESAPWRQVLSIANDKASADARRVLSRMFGLLGTDRILDALDDENLDVRIAAMDEVIKVRDVRAVPQLVELLSDDNNSVRVTAAFALGRLRSADGRQPMIDILTTEGNDISPQLRRTIWVALSRIGGTEVFSILSAAFYSPVEADRRAVLQAFAELRHESAARELGNVFALRGPDDRLGLMALQLLRGLGDRLGAPALRPHLESANPQVRIETAYALAEFGDPAALPAMISMLDSSQDQLRVVALIAGITGVDVTERNDRVPFLRRWLRANEGRSQGEWLVAALAARNVPNTLDAAFLRPNAGTAQVNELTRLLVELNHPHLRPLVARVLRLTTGEDFGTVSMETDADTLYAIAERYRFLVDSGKAASGR